MFPPLYKNEITLVISNPCGNLQRCLELVELFQEFGVGLGGFELRELGNDGVRGAEEAALVGLLEHARVVEGIAACEHLEVQVLQVLHDLRLLVVEAQVVALDHVVFDFQVVAENRRESEVLHDGVGEFLERVRKNDYLGFVAEFVHKVAGAVEQAEVCNHVLDVRKLDAFALENLDAALHEHVVVGNVARSQAQVLDAGLFGDGDPDFRGEDTFKVQGNDTLFREHDSLLMVNG